MSYRPIGVGVQISGIIICAAITVAAAQIPEWIAIAISMLTGLIGLLLLFFIETRINFQNRSVLEVRSFLGFIPVWNKSHLFSEFCSIEIYCTSGDKAADDISSTWRVALRPHTGRLIDLKQFSSSPGAESPNAKTFARELSEQMELPIGNR